MKPEGSRESKSMKIRPIPNVECMTSGVSPAEMVSMNLCLRIAQGEQIHGWSLPELDE